MASPLRCFFPPLHSDWAGFSKSSVFSVDSRHLNFLSLASGCLLWPLQGSQSGSPLSSYPVGLLSNPQQDTITIPRQILFPTMSPVPLWSDDTRTNSFSALILFIFKAFRSVLSPFRNQRKEGSRIAMGCYEYPALSFPSISSELCTALEHAFVWTA